MKFLLTGPTQDIGLRGPSSDPKFNQGTCRLVGNGDERKLQFELVVDADLAEGEKFVYFPSVTPDLVCFEVTDMDGVVLMPMQAIRGPAVQTELTKGKNQLFFCKQYGQDSLSFPASLAPGIARKTLKIRFFINPAVAGPDTSELIFGIIVEGNDHGLLEPIIWE